VSTEAPPQPVAAATVQEPRAKRFPNLTRGSVVAALVALLATGIGTTALSDNSFLTHLTTGRLILAGHFPHSDPYSFTAPGRHWVVQSWLASVLYGVADKLAGGVGIRLLVAVTTVLLALCLWRLTRPARTIMSRLLAVSVPLVIGSIAWGSRPLLFGLLFLALLVLIMEEGRDPRWLVPLMWVWVNTHGSFPLGFVYLVLLAVGGRLDGQDVHAEIRAVKWAALGILLGAISPVGPQLLLFPLDLLAKRKVLVLLAEWQAPQFTVIWQQLFLLFIMATVVLVPRIPTERRYRSTILVAVFTGAALLGSRNVVVASVVLLPVLATELRGLGSLPSSTRKPAYGVAVTVIGVAGAVLLVAGLARPSYDLSSYPVQSVTWLQDRGLLASPHRLATLDITGNYLEFRYRGKVPVFVDDRLDMFPTSVVDDEKTLMDGGPGWEKALDRNRIDTVLWDSKMPLTSVLRQSARWKLIHQDKTWSVFQRRSAS
jgi:hypothetical protein